MKTDYIEYEHSCFPRFEDMDSYGILHHSRYLLLVEEAKLAFMKNPKYFGRDVLDEDVKFLISDLHINYVNAIKYKVGVPVVVKLHFGIEEDTKIIFKFHIYYENKLACRGKAIHIVADQNNSLKLELPDGLVDRYEVLTGGKK